MISTWKHQVCVDWWVLLHPCSNEYMKQTHFILFSTLFSFTWGFPATLLIMLSYCTLFCAVVKQYPTGELTLRTVYLTAPAPHISNTHTLTFSFANFLTLLILQFNWDGSLTPDSTEQVEDLLVCVGNSSTEAGCSSHISTRILLLIAFYFILFFTISEMIFFQISWAPHYISFFTSTYLSLSRWRFYTCD